jgi:predicted nuclease of predicted toxin-antitoxin system
VKLWLDAQLSPALCRWLTETFDVRAEHVRTFQLHEAEDPDLFEAARAAAVDAVVTKDRDFIDLVERVGPPPKVIWITVGNTSNENLKRILAATLPDALALLEQGEMLVEVSEHRS